MKDIREFIKTDDLYLTLVNPQGEFYVTGAAEYVKPLSKKTTIKWDVRKPFTNVFPFTAARLGSLRKPVSVFAIREVLPTIETQIVLEF